MYKKYYTKFLKKNAGVQHFTAHSHHYWPDVTFDAMTEYWNDAATYVDDKWDYILGKKVPETQQLIADILNCDHPTDICFASNTHDLVIRLLSCFRKKIRILTTDSEFYSFSRQIARMRELHMVNIEIVSSTPYETFSERMIFQIKRNNYDLIFFSQVFFNSGIAVEDINRIVDSVETLDTVIAVDGYHGFMALPTDLSKIQDRIFYLAGSYKYAQGGEGCCFMTIPHGTILKPAITGWFAGFNNLENTTNELAFPPDGYRFAGSTLDYTALYRLNAVLRLYKKENITVSATHKYVQNLQNQFLEQLDQMDHSHLNRRNLIMQNQKHHGHFFSFKLPNLEMCLRLKKELREQKIITDSRGEFLRFGFSVYQENLRLSPSDLSK